MMRLAVDIGSNTIKCLLAQKKDGGVERVFENTLDNRISNGRGALAENAAEIIAASIENFISEAKKFAGDFETAAVATSAMRFAANAPEIVESVLARTGVRVKILSESAEANLSYLGAMSDNSFAHSGKNVFFDLGGGSLELVAGNGNTPFRDFSFPVGAVSMTKRFFPNGRICDAERAELENFLAAEFAGLSQFEKHFAGATLIGTGGAVVAARFMKKNCGLGGAENEIELSQIDKMTGLLSKLDIAERAEIYKIPQSRADIVVAGFVCMSVLMRVLRAKKLVHTFHNLRYGMILADMKNI